MPTVKNKPIYTGFIMLIAIIVIVTIFNTVQSGNSANISFGENELSITTASDEVFTMDYEDVISIELVSSLDFGNSAGGNIVNNIRSGKWENSSLGVYTAYCSTKIDSCIVLKSLDQTFVINYESNDTTAILCDSLADICGHN